MAKRAGGGRPSRMDLRRQAEAAEAQEEEKEDVEEAAEEEEAEEPDAEAEAEEGDGDDEGKPKKKKKAPGKKKAPAAKKPAAKRTRTAKEVRMKALWVVFDNGSKVVEKFPFNQKPDAEALLARKIAEKEGKAVFYLNLVKEPIE
ncbi:MAG: hypothetical protein U0804_15350 [Gemmataceae bacterium]